MVAHKKFIKRFSLLFLDQALRMAGSFVVAMLMARAWGPEQLGRLQYALAISYLPAFLVNLQLGSLMLRDFGKAEADRQAVIGNAFFLRTLGAFLMLAAICVSFYWLPPEDDALRWMLLMMTGGMMLQNFLVIETVFQADRHITTLVLCKQSIFIVTNAWRLWCIFTDAPLLVFCVSYVIEGVMLALSYLGAHRYHGYRLRDWRLKLPDLGPTVRRIIPLSLASLGFEVQARVDQIMLGNMLGDAAVGQYASVIRLVAAAGFVPMILIATVVPALSRVQESTEGAIGERQQLFTTYYRLSVLVALPIAVPMVLMPEFIIHTIYGAAFAPAAAILPWFALRIIMTYVSSAKNQFLIFSDAYWLTPIIAVGGAGLNIALNWWLIPLYGLHGAVYASLISSALMLAGIDLFARAGRQNAKVMLPAIATFWRLRRPHLQALGQ